ncbi:hypothetical protein OW774_23830 [Klebsiella pneumoniae]
MANKIDTETSGISRRTFFGGIALGLLAVAFAPVFSVSTTHAAQGEGKGKTLIVYYSWGGNTRQIAGQIQKTIQADVVELKTIDPYPEEYRPTTVHLSGKKSPCTLPMREAASAPPKRTWTSGCEKSDSPTRSGKATDGGSRFPPSAKAGLRGYA